MTLHINQVLAILNFRCYSKNRTKEMPAERGEAMIGYSEKMVVRNLKDAGCSPEMIIKFMGYAQESKKEEQLSLLEKHRKELLDKVHVEEKRIDCLDYLVYQVRQNRIRI